MSDQTRKIAVLTGDLVNSTGLGPEKVEQAFHALENCAAKQAEWMDGQSLHFTRHRGDGWQVALREPKYALRSALCFRAALRALGEEFDSYIGIAEGDVEREIGPDLNEAFSQPFTRSGSALTIAKNSPVSFIHFARNPPKHALAITLDTLSRMWTSVQAETMKYYLPPAPIESPSYSELGNALGKSRQSIKKSLDAAHFNTFANALNNIEVSINA